jgi:hypothetical protein
MTNADIIGNLTLRLIAQVNFRMSVGDTYAQALEYARTSSTAGPAVWERVAEHFRAIGDALDSTMRPL